MGHTYTLSGTVIHGEKLGRKLGFPTANLQIFESYKLIPADGIYAVTVGVGERSYNGMLYIGNRPIVHGTKKSIEVNIFDFNEDIYDQQLTVSIKAFIRGDYPFMSMDDLVKKMNEDRDNATKILS